MSVCFWYHEKSYLSSVRYCAESTNRYYKSISLHKQKLIESVVCFQTPRHYIDDERETKGQRDKETERERQRERETKRKRERETKRQRDRD